MIVYERGTLTRHESEIFSVKTAPARHSFVYALLSMVFRGRHMVNMYTNISVFILVHLDCIERPHTLTDLATYIQ